MQNLKRYRLTLLSLAAALAIGFTRPSLGLNIAVKTGTNFRDMFSVLPPIFILLGLLEVWVPREVIMKNLGERSGLRGIALSIFLGAAAAGPLYVAFPVAVAMLKKGARFGNITIFLFTWSTLKVPLLLFEATALGWCFTLLRAAINLPAIIMMGTIVDKLIPPAEKEQVREKQIQLELAQTAAGNA